MSISASVFSQCPADQGTNYAEGLYINEVSQGQTGNEEFVELVVVGNTTCGSSNCVDISGWIVDDNSGILSSCTGSCGGNGIQNGHIRFSSQWSCIPNGSIIVIYNINEPNGSLPGDDPTDSNGDHVYVVSSTDSSLEFNEDVPMGGTGITSYSGASYSGSTSTPNSISMSNSNDGIGVYDPSDLSNPFHSVGWGVCTNVTCSFGAQGGSTIQNINSVDTDPTNCSNFDNPSASSESPGSANSVENQDWINTMLPSVLYLNLDTDTTSVTCNAMDGEIIITPPSPYTESNYTFTWTPSTLSGANPTGLDIGTYDVTVCNRVTGCDTMMSFTLDQLQCCPTISITPPTNTICDGNCENMMIDVNGPNTVNIPFEINGISLGTIPVSPGNNSIPICYGPAAIPPPLTIPSGVFSPGTYTVNIPPFNDSDGCPHNLGSFSITLTAAPVLNIPNVLDGCGEYILPPISGTNLTGSEGYYTGSEGTGTLYTAGDIIYSDLTLYIYDGTTGCSDEKLINITVTPEPDIDPIGPINQCGDYLLPNITGTNLSFNPGYYTGSNGTGTLYNPGDVISSSLTLYIFDVTSPGCFDEEVLDITINNQTSGIDNISDCNPITWIDGNTYSVSNNTATHTLTAANGCDSIVTLDFTLLQQLTGTDVISDCTPILWIDGNTYSSSNNSATHTLTAANGCDSIVTLNFTLLPQLTGTDNITDCNPITWIDGNTYNANNNTATHTLTAANGCDSIVTLNFTLLPQLTGTDIITDCNQITWIDGNTYSANNNTATHTLTAANGCDSIVTLNFTLLPQLTGTDIITDCNPITWIDGNTYSANNNTATHTLTAANGCDSIVTLNFTLLSQLTGTDIITDCNQITWIDGNTYSANNNTATHTLTAANGCDSIVTLNFTLLPQLTGTDVINDCNPINWIDGNTYNSNNNSATHTLTAANGCDSIVTLNFTLLPKLSGTDVINDCKPITWIDGNTYNSNNNSATHTLTAANGCDSIVTLNFTLLPQLTGTDNITDCNQITWIDGNTYTTNNNTATHTLTAANGCDSIVTLNFTLLPQLTGTDNITDCNQITWIDGNTYNASNNTATHTLTAANGCDSIVTLNFTLLQQLTGTDNITDCNQITWIDGNTYNASNNTATHTLTAANGCDSIVTLNFTLLQQLTGTDNITDCNQITWIDGNIYNASNNTATHTVTAANGCDSIVTLNFTLLPQLTGTDNITDCNPINWIDGNTYTTNNNTATHTLTAANGCDSIVTLNFTLLPQLTGTDNITDCKPITWIDGNTYTTNNNTATHTLTSSNGCDSIVTLNFTINPLTAEIKTPTVCPDSSGKLIITSVNSLGSPFTLTMANQTMTFTDSMLPLTVTTPSSAGQITLIDSKGCNFSNSYEINTYPEPDPKINHTDEEVFIESNDSTFNHILWKPQEVFDCPTCESTSYTIDESIKVMASYTYGDGCPGSVSYLLARSAENPDIIFPNAFAPEGTNRVFYVDVSYAENVSIESMAIYDRWGNKVFYSEDQSSLNNKGGWDGTINEKAAHSGVYTFLIGLKTRDNVEYYSGDVVLVR